MTVGQKGHKNSNEADPVGGPRMIDTDVLPLRVRSSGSRGSNSRAELLVSPRRTTDWRFCNPLCAAIRDLMMPRHQAKAMEIHMQVLNRTRQVVIASDLGIAKTSAQRRRGLLGRACLPHGEGLWISPCESVHTVGMRFPIDLVYVDRDNRVCKIRRDVRPWRISFCITAHSVIELPAGTSRATGTREGDHLEFCCAVPVG
jgi:hypothetical protein